MKKAILATKVGMTQVYNEAGVLVPVTVLQAGPCVVTRVKSEESDGYNAVQVAYGQIRTKLVNKPDAGQLEKAGIEKEVVTRGEHKREVFSAGRFLREFRFENASEYNVKDVIKADIFAAGDKVDATAVSKGKGFQGAIKKHGQHRGPMAHGSKFHRHQGSNGSSSDPSRVFKGKGMPGHMGHVTVTTQNLEVVRVDAENNLILVKGAIPGSRKALVTLRETVKSKKANVSVYNTDGKEVGTIELNDAVFGVELNEHLVHLAVVAQLANKRQGTQKAKTRSEVSGGGRKPWRQKGTGHARQGSTRSPQWKGGGVVFAPSPRYYTITLNKKEKRQALRCALSSRVREQKFIVLESFELSEIKTKKMAETLKNLKVQKALVVAPENDKTTVLSARNIAGVKTASPKTINVYDILKYNTVVTSKDVVATIEEVYA